MSEKSKTFEASMTRLEQIVRELEKGDAPLEDDDRHGSGLAVEHAPAPAGGQRRVVRGPQEIGAVLHHGDDGALAEGVVAQGDEVGAGLEQVVGLLGVDADVGGVLAVDDAEIGAVGAFQPPQPPAQVVRAAGGHHVADGQDLELHGRTSFRFVILLYYVPVRRARKNLSVRGCAQARIVRRHEKGVYFPERICYNRRRKTGDFEDRAGSLFWRYRTSVSLMIVRRIMEK